MMSLNESLAQAVPGLGFVLGGVLASLTDPRVALAVAAAGSLAYAVAVWLGLRPGAIGEAPEAADPGRPDARRWPRRPRTARPSRSGAAPAAAGGIAGVAALRCGRTRPAITAVRLGCIDIGSNTTRLLVAECDGRRLAAVHQERAFTRIGSELLDARVSSARRRSPRWSRWSPAQLAQRARARGERDPRRWPPRRSARPPTAPSSSGRSRPPPGLTVDRRAQRRGGGPARVRRRGRPRWSGASTGRARRGRRRRRLLRAGRRPAAADGELVGVGRPRLGRPHPHAPASRPAAARRRCTAARAEIAARWRGWRCPRPRVARRGRRQRDVAGAAGRRGARRRPRCDDALRLLASEPRPR